MGAVWVIGAIVVLTAIVMLAQKGRDQVRRKGTRRSEYEKEQSLTETCTVITTVATVEQVKTSINRNLEFSDSFKSEMKGDNYKILKDSETRTVIHHNLTLSLMSKVADDFTAVIQYKTSDKGLRVLVQIIEWKEMKGVATRTALDAMQFFIDRIVASVRAVDPDAQVEVKQIPKSK